MVDLLAVIGIIILTLFLWIIVYVAIPFYLADKAAKLLFPSLCIKPVDSRSRYIFAIIVPLFPLVIFSTYLQYHLGLPTHITHIQLPTWFPWAPEGLHHLYHSLSLSLLMNIFISRFIVVLFFGWRMKIKDNSSRSALT